METSLDIVNAKEKTEAKPNYVIDTTFVLFFLALDLGQNASLFAFDTVFLAITLLTVAVMPYFLMTDEKIGFAKWLLGRGLIAGFAVLLGIMFKQSLGTVLPEYFSFLPFTLLMITAMLCCFIQFYSFLRLRLSK